ncbi:MAG TPA: hypothetical protein DCE41_31025, partial [Cytophagales bacterium]|nr:hypothetical protein [Cytophagales bacterium]
MTVNNHTVTLPQNLKGFAEPNPDSYVAEVPAGEYPLFKILTQYPSSDTDFVQLDLPNTDEDLWVCIRWKEQVYGQIVANYIAAAAPPVNFLSEADLSAVSGPVFHAPEQEQLSVQGPESTQPALLTPQLYVKQPLKSFQSPNTQ